MIIDSVKSKQLNVCCEDSFEGTIINECRNYDGGILLPSTWEDSANENE